MIQYIIVTKKSLTMKLKIAVSLIILITIVLFVFLPKPEKTVSKSYKMIQWVELMPKEDADALYNTPEAILDIPEELENKISKAALDSLIKAQDSEYQKALSSKNVIKEFDHQNIKIPGFVVPVEINDAGRTTGFFIVPYFGACLHYPPPPPNQTIYAEYIQGFDIREIYKPFFFKGEITISNNKNKIAESAYLLKTDEIEKFYE